MLTRIVSKYQSKCSYSREPQQNKAKPCPDRITRDAWRRFLWWNKLAHSRPPAGWVFAEAGLILQALVIECDTESRRSAQFGEFPLFNHRIRIPDRTHARVRLENVPECGRFRLNGRRKRCWMASSRTVIIQLPSVPHYDRMTSMLVRLKAEKHIFLIRKPMRAISHLPRFNTPSAVGKLRVKSNSDFCSTF